mmetsp:Transcript_5151/g.12113  ORF Transcript_5151/g.12113 Transcript_5151/m.12113 type:complete len:229 (-) Transcript_5151:304-990(-)
MVATLVRESDNHLLQKGEALVDECRLFQRRPERSRLLQSFAASEVHQMDLGIDHPLIRLHSRPALHKQGHHKVTPARQHVQRMLRHRPRRVGLEESLETLLLCQCYPSRQALDAHTALAVLLDLLIGRSVAGRGVGEEVHHELVVDLEGAQSDGDGAFWACGDCGEEGGDAAGDDAAVCEVGGAPHHGEGLASPCLSVCHAGAIEAVEHTGAASAQQLPRKLIKHPLL